MSHALQLAAPRRAARAVNIRPVTDSSMPSFCASASFSSGLQPAKNCGLPS
jgi:hypothetical protein